MKYFSIAVSAPLKKPLVYKTQDSRIVEGSVIQVPLGSRKVQGLVLSSEKSAEDKTSFKIKEILGFEELLPPLQSVHIQWIRWLSEYYRYPIGQVAHSCYPSKKFRISGNVEIKTKTSPLPKLNEEQKKCLDNIKSHSVFKAHLLHGVTGSGKTEVYFHLIQEHLQKGKQILVMIPEISLTSQLHSRFSNQFHEAVGVLHSGLTGKQKYQEWMDFVSGRKKILLGARSALFCPLPNLSLIIVDEEHEVHFKQEEKLKYQARDAAIMRAKMHNIPIVLGSATPNLTTWFHAQQGLYQYHQLKNRFQNRPFPKIQIVDLKTKKNNLPFWMSSELYQSIKKTLESQKQVALFLNRRGQTSLSLCFECGSTQMCPNCDISLTLHSHKYLTCHYCNYSVVEGECSVCKSDQISHLGIGTQKVYSEIEELFPKLRVRVADSDHIQKPKDFENLVKDMENRKIDILIGTQMIAKGFDFPHLELVGILLADLFLYDQDYRAVERCFQMLTQMGGRSGRHSIHSGQVIIQTYDPSHWVIQKSASMNFKEMAEEELGYREKLNYPPFCRLVSFQVSSLKQSQAYKVAQEIARKIRGLKGIPFECLGPSPESIFKLRLRYRYHILVKSKSSGAIQKICDFVDSIRGEFKFVRVQINRDP